LFRERFQLNHFVLLLSGCDLLLNWLLALAATSSAAAAAANGGKEQEREDGNNVSVYSSVTVAVILISTNDDDGHVAFGHGQGELGVRARHFAGRDSDVIPLVHSGILDIEGARIFLIAIRSVDVLTVLSRDKEIDLGSNNAGEIEVERGKGSGRGFGLGQEYLVVEDLAAESSLHNVPADLGGILVGGEDWNVRGGLVRSRAESKDVSAEIVGIGNRGGGLDRIQDVASVHHNEGIALFLWNELGDSSTDLVHLVENVVRIHSTHEDILKGSND